MYIWITDMRFAIFFLIMNVCLAQTKINAGISATGFTDGFHVGFSRTVRSLELGLNYRFLFRRPVFWPAWAAYDQSGNIVGWNGLKYDVGRQETRDLLNMSLVFRWFPKFNYIHHQVLFMESAIFVGNASNHTHPKDVFDMYPIRYSFVEPSIGMGMVLPVEGNLALGLSVGVSNPVYYMIDNRNKHNSYWLADGLKKCMSVSVFWSAPKKPLP